MKTYAADSELAELLKTAESSGELLRVVANGSSYLLQVQREPVSGKSERPAPSDPQKVRNALRKYAGSWSDLDADELKAAMYRARDEGSRRSPFESGSVDTTPEGEALTRPYEGGLDW